MDHILLAGAVGDAFGSFYENREGPCQYLEHDEWVLTDDTALTLATAEAIIGEQRITVDGVARKFVAYFDSGRVIRAGASTIKALTDLKQGVLPIHSGATGERSAGNGPASRIAPLHRLVRLSDPDDRKLIRSVCFITHRNDEAYAGALAVLAALQSEGDDPIDAAIRVLPDSNTKETLGKIRDLRSPIGKVAQITGVSGYTAESIPLALYAGRAGKAIGFRRAIIEVCCCGGDADTIAAIAGQIMASKGLTVPADWAGKVPQREQIVAIGKLIGDVTTARE